MTAAPDHHPEPADGHVELADGRSMTYRRFGHARGRVVVALHGTPGSRLKFASSDTMARALGLTVIAPDRWGYGGTSQHPFPTLSAFASDIETLADKLSVARFAVMGVSGGGPFAVATAALLAQRVDALALVAPVGPLVPGLDMTAFHRFCFGPFARRPRAVRAVFRGFNGLLRLSGELGLRIGMVNVAAADRRVLSDGTVRRRLTDTFLEGLRPGSNGPVLDLALFSAPWQVPLRAAAMPARLWLGTADRNVPLAAARHLAAALPRCRLEILDGEGHLWVAHHYDAVLGWIAGTLERSPKTS